VSKWLKDPYYSVQLCDMYRIRFDSRLSYQRSTIQDAIYRGDAQFRDAGEIYHLVRNW
jgi:hypothetical protein